MTFLNTFSWKKILEILFISFVGHFWILLMAGYHISSVLTLNMLNCFKDYKRYTPISYHILDFVQHKKTKFTMEQPYMLPILFCQYHACWCPSDLRSWGISRNDIDQISLNIPFLVSEQLISLYDSVYKGCVWFSELMTKSTPTWIRLCPASNKPRHRIRRPPNCVTLNQRQWKIMTVEPHSR